MAETEDALDDGFCYWGDERLVKADQRRQAMIGTGVGKNVTSPEIARIQREEGI